MSTASAPQVEPYIPPGHNEAVASNPLRRWRVQSGTSQAAAEKALNVRPGTINGWETGKRLPRPASMESLVRLTEIENLPTLWHRWYVEHRL